MLSSLLPGLRDVRTPLAVGYLWLLIVWLWFGGTLTESEAYGRLADTFSQAAFLGEAALLGAVSFTAYLLGSLVYLPVERGRLVKLLRRIFPAPYDARQTARDYYALLQAYEMRITQRSGGFEPREFDELRSETARASRSGADELRPRLLVANQELYGEYDRLAAEGTFRLNIGVPLYALVITLTWTEGRFLGIALGGVATVYLLIQGWSRLWEAESVLQRAVLSSILEHPLKTISDRFS